MAEVVVKENEPFDQALKRFKRKFQQSGILAEIKKHEYYEKPSERRKKKARAARKKRNRRG